MNVELDLWDGILNRICVQDIAHLVKTRKVKISTLLPISKCVDIFNKNSIKNVPEGQLGSLL